MFEQGALLTSVDGRVGLGVLSGLLSLLCFGPYITDTLARRTQPDRACWLIWSVLSAIALLSQIHEGATMSLAFAGVQVGGTIVVFLLSIRLGAGAYLSRKNVVFFILAGVGLLAWYVTEAAAYALAIGICISLLGGLLTLQKSYLAPESETLSKWGMGLVASLCAVGSVGALDPVLLAYPVYLVVLNGAIVAAMLLGRLRHTKTRMTDAMPVFVHHNRRAAPYVLTPKRQIFDQVSQFAAQKDMQVPAENGQIRNDDQQYEQPKGNRNFVGHQASGVAL